MELHFFGSGGLGGEVSPNRAKEGPTYQDGGAALNSLNRVEFSLNPYGITVFSGFDGLEAKLPRIVPRKAQFTRTERRVEFVESC